MGFLRIEDERLFAIAPTKGVVALGGPRKSAALSVYGNNLTKLVPGEALSLHAALQSVPVPKGLENFHVIPFACLVLTIILRCLATAPKGKRWPPQPFPVIVAAISFVLWTYSEHDWFFAWQMGPIFSYFVTIGFFLWVAVTPLFVGGSRSTG